VIVAGTRLCGKVDESQVGFVVTRFVHVWFVPLIPLSSWFVTAGGARPVPFSLKSAFVGYVRGWGVLAALGGFGGFVYLCTEYYGRFEIYFRGGTAVGEAEVVTMVIHLAVLGVLAVLGAVAFIAMRFLSKAGAARCAELSRTTGLNVVPL